MALYHHYSSTLSLKVPLKTRFTCNFFMIACMLEVKDALKWMVIDSRWNEYVSIFFNRQNSHRAYALADMDVGPYNIFDFQGLWHLPKNYCMHKLLCLHGRRACPCRSLDLSTRIGRIQADALCICTDPWTRSCERVEFT
jgi:hypothetical protein